MPMNRGIHIGMIGNPDSDCIALGKTKHWARVGFVGQHSLCQLSPWLNGGVADIQLVLHESSTGIGAE